VIIAAECGDTALLAYIVHIDLSPVSIIELHVQHHGIIGNRHTP
jgi:hypothetical protein